MIVSFAVAGTPSTKGSSRAFVVKGRAIVTNDAGPKAKAWAACVSHQATLAMAGRAPLDCAVSVALTFWLQRPKGHRRASGDLKASAPAWQSSRPDIDKLARCCLDALTGIVLVDDARIAKLIVQKWYTDGATGVDVVVNTLGVST